MKIEIIEKWFEKKQVLNKEQFELLKFMFEFIQEEKTIQTTMVSPVYRAKDHKPEHREKQGKQCFRCKQLKPREDFYINKKNTDGLQTYCKTCQKLVCKEGKKKKKALKEARKIRENK